MADAAKESVNGQHPRKTPDLRFFRRVEHHIQGRTVGGLMELVPLLVTVVVLAFIITKADSFVRPLNFVAGRPWDFTGIGLISLISLIVIFYLVGLVMTTRFGRTAMDLKSAVLKGVPVVGAIYGVTQQATTAMASQYNYSRVVFLEWPREGMIALGFLTGRAVSAATGETLVVVYIPTVPNPTSGNMAFVMEDDVIETDMSVEDAMKMVFSGGIVLPESLAFARVPREPLPNEFIGRFNAASE